MLSYNIPLLQAAAQFTPHSPPIPTSTSNASMTRSGGAQTSPYMTTPGTQPHQNSAGAPCAQGVPVSPQAAAAAAMIFRNSAAEAATRLFPAYYLHPGSAAATAAHFDYASASGINNIFNAYTLVQEEPKPNHSYIGLIALAILSSPDKKLVLSDIYQYILDNYPYFRTRGPGWRNSIRHNLSLNDCFIKAGRSANGKGHFWAVHPACEDDFAKGDFRRRHAQRKVRKAMGLSVPDEESDGARTPSPHKPTNQHAEKMSLVSPGSVTPTLKRRFDEAGLADCAVKTESHFVDNSPVKPGSFLDLSPPLKKSRKRAFNIASLLLPDNQEEHEGDNDL